MHDHDSANRRILIIDDNPAIHEDFRKIFGVGSAVETALAESEAALFGTAVTTHGGDTLRPNFRIDSALQGQEGLALVCQAREERCPYALAFIDVRMPPGWDGVETTSRIWAEDPDVQVVICTAYSDYSWDEMLSQLGSSDRLVILKKPFDNIEVLQLANALSEKWRLTQQVRRRVEDLEQNVSERTHELQQSREQYRLIVEGTNAIPFTLDLASDRFTYVGPQAFARLGFVEEQWKQPGFLDALLPRASNSASRQRIDECGSGSFEIESKLTSPGGGSVELRWVVNCEISGGTRVLRGLLLDISNERQLERELAQAQKLESVGRLAAGMAHEINTPLQFISDSVHFVQESVRDMLIVIAKYRAAGEAERSTDLDYVIDNTPKALDNALEGIERVTTIVRSMKEFAHPDRQEKALVDLNRAIRSTMAIANDEYRDVAELETEFGELPPVLCHAGEIKQAILNLLVNAAHAIADVVKDDRSKGRLTVRTCLDGAEVEISISDTGAGIPVEISEKVFDPFFTTKEVGKGTGQGLAIARSVVVNRHGGSLHFETESGKGTTFYIRLPVGE